MANGGPIGPPVGTIRREFYCASVSTLFGGVSRASVSIYLIYHTQGRGELISRNRRECLNASTTGRSDASAGGIIRREFLLRIHHYPIRRIITNICCDLSNKQTSAPGDLLADSPGVGALSRPSRPILVLIGDSDISRWPSPLYPIIPSGTSVVINNYGTSGACLVDLPKQIDQWKVQNEDRCDSNCLFICCAGENDIGSGITIERITEAFRAILDAMFPSVNPDQRHESRMIFFGPKFEPWLTDDHASRKKYAKLNNGLQRAIRKHHACDRVMYVDCLTLFCTKETAFEPGAVYGGRGIPDVQYFDSDGLHLNDAGYRVWKRIIESKI